MSSETKPREWWRRTFEAMETPLEKFEYLTGLAELSWDDCCDAWFESKKLIPEVSRQLSNHEALQKKCADLEADHKAMWEALAWYANDNNISEETAAHGRLVRERSTVDGHGECYWEPEYGIKAFNCLGGLRVKG